MGLFSRRKSSTQHYAKASPHICADRNQVYETSPLSYLEKTSSHSTPASTGFPLSDRTDATVNGHPSRPPTDHTRPTTASSIFRKLSQKSNRKGKQPPTASRAFVTDVQHITPSGRPIGESRTQTDVFLPTNISSTNVHSQSHIRPLKVRPFDILKSNPRLNYLGPTEPPTPISTPSKDLAFHHDGRVVFASNTVANIADQLDSHGLRKLMERDAKRHGQGRYRSNEELRVGFGRQSNEFARQTPRTRGKSVSTHYTSDWHGGNNIFLNSEPSIMRSVTSSNQSQSSISDDVVRGPIFSAWTDGYGSFHQFSDPGPSTVRSIYPSIKSSLPTNRVEGDSPSSSDQATKTGSTAATSQHSNPSPILLYYHHNPLPQEVTPPSSQTSPVILVRPSSQSNETTAPAELRGNKESPIQLFSQPTELRPPVLSFATDPSSAQDTNETETEIPTSEDEELNDLLCNPDCLPATSSLFRSPWLAPPQHSESEQESLVDYAIDDEDSRAGARYPQSEIPIISNPSPMGSFAVEVGSRSISISEDELLKGKFDIHAIVRESFAASASSRRTPPIMLESIPRFPSAGSLSQIWESDYEVGEYYTEDEGALGTERVRQGSKARKVQVVDSVDIMEREKKGEVASEENLEDKENGGILLF